MNILLQQCSLARANDCLTCARKEGRQPGVACFLLCLRSRGSAVPSDRRPPWRDRCLSAADWFTHVYTMAPNGSKFDPIRYLKISEDNRSSWRALLTLLLADPCSIVSSISSGSQAESCRVDLRPLQLLHYQLLAEGRMLPLLQFMEPLSWRCVSMLIYAGCCSGFGVWWPVIHDAEVIWIHHSIIIIYIYNYQCIIVIRHWEDLGSMFKPGNSLFWCGPQGLRISNPKGDAIPADLLPKLRGHDGANGCHSSAQPCSTWRVFAPA